MLLKMETHGSRVFGGRNLRVDAGKHSKCLTFETNTPDKTSRNHLIKSAIKYTPQLRTKSRAVLHSKLCHFNTRIKIRSRNLSNVMNNNALDDLINESQPQNIEAGQSRCRDGHRTRNVTPFPKAIHPYVAKNSFAVQVSKRFR